MDIKKFEESTDRLVLKLFKFNQVSREDERNESKIDHANQKLVKEKLPSSSFLTLTRAKRDFLNSPKKLAPSVGHYNPDFSQIFT